MRLTLALVTALLLALPASQATAQNGVDCEAARCAVQDAINQECPCEAATNHGKHVSCVAHVVKRLSREGVIPTNCKGKVKRCAARSTCGKPGFVTCTFNELGTCDLVNLVCDMPAGQPCASNADCVISSKCRTKSSIEHCEARGGIAGQGTCCASCAAPQP